METVVLVEGRSDVLAGDAALVGRSLGRAGLTADGFFAGERSIDDQLRRRALLGHVTGVRS